MIRSTAVRLVAFLLLAFAAAMPLAATDENAIVISGSVTHVDTELEFIVVNSNHGPGLYTEILVPCPSAIDECGEVEVDDKVVILGHFGQPAAVCGGEELPDNPVVIDKMTCIGILCLW